MPYMGSVSLFRVAKRIICKFHGSPSRGRIPANQAGHSPSPSCTVQIFSYDPASAQLSPLEEHQKYWENYHYALWEARIRSCPSCAARDQCYQTVPPSATGRPQGLPEYSLCRRRSPPRCSGIYTLLTHIPRTTVQQATRATILPLSWLHLE